MEYSKKQQLISLVNKKLGDNRYIENKREEGQQKIFKCNCCGKDFDFTNSIDYVEAVEQWKRFGGKCYACANGFCYCKD